LDPSAPGDSLTAFARDVGRQHHLEAVPLEARDQGHADPGVARGRLQEDGAGLETTFLLGGLDHGQGDAVLHRPTGVLPLELDEDAGARIGAQRADIDERRVPDQIEDALDDDHRRSLLRSIRSNLLV
jgi:hypothetical protein